MRKAALEDFKKKIAGQKLTEEDGQALFGELEGKLGDIDALIKGEEELQNRRLAEALERRRKRRGALQDKLGTLMDKKEAQEEKLGRKLR